MNHFKRVNSIMDVLSKTEGTPQSAREIAQMYLTEVTTSDVLTTGTILNTLTALGMVKKEQLPGKRKRFVFSCQL